MCTFRNCVGSFLIFFLFIFRYLRHDESGDFFFASSPDCGTQCESEVRTCNNGQLNGTAEHPTCAQNCPSCTVGGRTVQHSQVVTFYREASVGCGGQCEGELRACYSGVINGTYVNANCAPEPCPCYYTDAYNVTVRMTSGESGYYYATDSVGCGETCQIETRTCTNGILSGNFTYPRCSTECQRLNIGGWFTFCPSPSSLPSLYSLLRLFSLCASFNSFLLSLLCFIFRRKYALAFV